MTLLWLVLAALPAAERQVALTIDDLPVAQSGPGACAPAELGRITEALLRPIERGKVPVTAFVIAGNCADLPVRDFARTIRRWQRAGAVIGNHTYSHRSFNTLSLEEYTADIDKADVLLREITGRPVRFFRSPMLHAGDTREKAIGLERFLTARGYRQSPVTFDNADWMFAFVYAAASDRGEKELAARVVAAYVPYIESVIAFFEQRAVTVAGRAFPQVMLLHANRLNAERLPDILAMFRRCGYRFVPLDEALRDPAYQLPNEYAGKGGFSWIHRWSMTKKLPPRGEPDEPAWLREAYERLR